MKKVYMVLSILFLILITNRITSNAQTATAPSGSGTIGDPYLIATVENLYWVATQTNSGNSFSGKYLKQTADLDASATSTWFGGQGWMPIGYSTDNGFFTYYVFSGNYDGQNHIISNLLINRTIINGYGLFGITDYATIKNLGVTNITIIATGDNDMYAGGLIGYAIAGNTIENCYSTGSVTCRWSPGGLIGAVVDETNPNTVTNCYSDCDVIATYWVAGGLIAESYLGSTITNCYSTGSVTALGEITYVGGLIGNNVSAITNCYSTSVVTAGSGGSIGGLIGDNYGNISNCYFSGSVVSNGHEVGGLIGRHSAYYGSIVNNCYSSGVVFGIANTGGLIGLNTGVPATNVTNCFWDSQTSGQVASPGGGTGKTTLEMKTASTFTNAGWSALVWSITNGNYPILLWQIPATSTFTGTGNWSTAGNWSSGLPATTTDVIIDGNCNVDAGYEVSDLTINNGRVLSINPGNTLTVSGTLTNNAGTSGLVFSSNATGTGMLMNNTVGVQATVNQYLVKDQWHYIGIPVSFIPDANTVFHNCYLAFLDESDAYNGLSNGWQFLSTGDPLRKMHGYAVQYNTGTGDHDTTITFTGILNTGTIDTVFASETEGWNFVSNPYPVTMDWDASGGKTITNGNDAIYVWNPNLNSGSGDYGAYGSYISGGSTNGQTQYIAPMQGFYFEVWATNAALEFTNNVKVNQTVAFKSAVIVPQIRLAVTDNNINFDEMLLREINDATLSFDSRFDAGKLKALNSKQPLLYSVWKNKEYSINSLPEISADLVLPLEILVKSTGEHRLILKELKDFSKSYPIILLDENGKFLKELNIEDYIFNATAGETIKLKLAFSTATDNGDVSKKSDIWLHTKENSIIINGLKNIPSEIKVFNVTGQLIFDEIVAATTVPISVNERGMYIVSVAIEGKRVYNTKTIVSF